MNNLPNKEVIDLLNRIRKYDDSASRRLYSAYRNQIFRYVQSRIWSQDAVEDIVQETMMAAFKSENYDGSSLYSTWLCSIAKNKINDWYDYQSRHPLAEEEQDSSDELGLYGIALDEMTKRESDELLVALRHCIEKLPRIQRSVVRLSLSDDENASQAAIATELDIPEGTVKSRHYHGREALKKCIGRVFPHLVKGAPRG